MLIGNMGIFFFFGFIFYLRVAHEAIQSGADTALKPWFLTENGMTIFFFAQIFHIYLRLLYLFIIFPNKYHFSSFLSCVSSTVFLLQSNL